MAISNIAGGFSKIWHKGGEPHAMVSLLTVGINSLQRFLPVYLEYELDDFFKSLGLCLAEAKRWRRGETRTCVSAGPTDRANRTASPISRIARAEKTSPPV